jgi:hypothetical protein
MSNLSASVRTLPAQGTNEHLARRARKGAHQQWAHAVSRFPRASHVQYPIYFWNIQMQQLQCKKKTDETLFLELHSIT